MRLVIFDFDGTIHLKETPRLFLRVLGEDEENRGKVRKFYISVAWIYLLYRFGLCRELILKRVPNGIAKIMTGMSQSQIEGFFRKCLDGARENFSSVSLKRVQAHIEAGDQVLLLSGAFAPFVSLVAIELGMQYWLGTELELADGLCTGRITSLLIGILKVQALRTFLQEQKVAGVIFDMGEAYAYADGIRDLPLLSLVGHPVAVNPDQELRREARQRGWEIIEDHN